MAISPADIQSNQAHPIAPQTNLGKMVRNGLQNTIIAIAHPIIGAVGAAFYGLKTGYHAVGAVYNFIKAFNYQKLENQHPESLGMGGPFSHEYAGLENDLLNKASFALSHTSKVIESISKFLAYATLAVPVYGAVKYFHPLSELRTKL